MTMHPPVSRVMFPSMPIAGESLMGLVARTADDNIHASTSHILRAAGYPHDGSFDLAAARPERLPDLAAVLGVPLEEAERRFYPPVDPHRHAVNFFGAAVPATALRFRHRRVAPRALRISAHHHAILTHSFLPYCPETGGWIISRCPACDRNLGWYHARGIAVCEGCRFDLRQYDNGGVDEEERMVLAPFVDLIHPDSARHHTAFSKLSPALQPLGRGECFELGRWLACLIHAEESQGARYLKVEGTSILHGAIELLADWPAGVERQLESVAQQQGAEALGKLLKRLRAAVASHGWPALRRVVREGVLDTFVYADATRAARKFVPILAATEVKQQLGIGAPPLRTLKDLGLITQVSGGDVRGSRTGFDKSSIDHIVRVMEDRLTGAAIANRLGISNHGVEQLVCLGLLEEITDPAVRSLKQNLQVTRTSFDALLRALADGSQAIPANQEPVSLQVAMRFLGGREKPWGPIMAAMCAGTPKFHLRNPEGSYAFRIAIRREDVAQIDRFEFDAARFGTFLFAETMTSRDAGELLNLTPALMLTAVKEELGKCLDGKARLLRKAVLKMAHERISGSEISHRWMGGSRSVPQELRHGGSIARRGAIGWPRCDVEHFFEAKVGDGGSNRCSRKRIVDSPPKSLS